MYSLDLSLIDKAASFLEGKIRKTPIEYSSSLSELLKVPVYLKCEFLQITGSFKIRGALFYLSTLSPEERQNGVAACSAGNHGLAIAFAAKELGVQCTVFVPKNVDRAKYQKMLELGAIVRQSAFNGYDDTFAWAKKEAFNSRLHLISPFDNDKIMAGNGGSLAVEILREFPSMQNFIVPVGGGGLSAGLAYYVKNKNPQARIIGCQHINSPALKLSMEKGAAVTTLPYVETVAGGIEGGIGESCFNVLKNRITDIALLSEKEIIKGFCWMFAHHQYLIEPTAAVVIAGCLFHKMPYLKGPTIVVLSGRNVSFTTLQKLVRDKKNNENF